ncbi:MAG TPA: folylpolyglutamate synthase/dihydrofolate synthase family protein [Candidatus Hydrogenedens sp.]|nr:folylpolyglutamate synthase/dihydrofolate synthase family protein [Candidatus Hydrogenedens sp.]
MDVYSKGLPAEDIDFLKTLVLHGVKLGLENINALLHYVGEPQKKFLSVHVGGTNGKGSTVAYIDRIFREQGIRTGKFTSPHLIDLAERFQINGTPISTEELHEQITFFRNVIEKTGILPTFFEFCTAIAFHWFALQKVEWAIVEVGMGGRLDSTNIIFPKVCAITNIGLEHTQYLGDTLEKIASEKAGIIKEKVPVVIGEKKQEVRDIFYKKAKDLSAPLWQIEKDFHVSWERTTDRAKLTYQSPVREIKGAFSRLSALYQCENAGVAIAVIDWLGQKGFFIKEEAILRGLANVRWPGRLDLISQSPWVLLDAAHNPDGIERLVENLEDKVSVVFSVADDKNVEGIIKLLSPYVNEFIITQFYGKRAMSAEKIKEIVSTTNVPFYIEQDFCSALEQGWKKAQQGHKLLVTGSIYAIGQTYEWLIKKGVIKKIEF